MDSLPNEYGRYLNTWEWVRGKRAFNPRLESSVARLMPVAAWITAHPEVYAGAMLNSASANAEEAMIRIRDSVSY